MDDVAQDLNVKLLACIQRKLRIRSLSELKLLEFDQNEWKDFWSAAMRCYLAELKKMGVRKFNAWMKAESEGVQKQLDEQSRRYVRYLSQFGDPAMVMEQLVPMMFGMESASEELEAQYFNDQTLSPRLLKITTLTALKMMRLLLPMVPLRDLSSIAQSTLNCEINWCFAVIAVSIEQLLVKKKLDEMGIETKPKESFDGLCEKLVPALQDKGMRPGFDVLLTAGHRQIRNRVIHEGLNPTDEELNTLIDHLARLARDLGPEGQKAART